MSSVPDSDLARLKQHLDAKWKERGCPMCNARRFAVAGFTQIPLASSVWDLQSTHAFTTEYGYGGIAGFEEPAQPLIPGAPTYGLASAAVVCTNCGHTILVNLVIAGMLDGR